MAQRASGKGPLRTLVILAGGLVALVVVAVVAVVLLLQTGAVSNRVKELVVPRISAALGRDVSVTEAKLRVLPNPRVALTGTTIAGRPGEPAFVEVESLDVEVALWPLVRSLGKDVRVEGITLLRPRVNLVRGRDGKWSHEGLGSGGTTAPAGGAPAQGPPAGGDGGRVFVAKAKIVDGTLRVVDRSQGRDDAAVALTKIDLDAQGGLGERMAAKLTAALAAEQKNLEVDVESPRLPEKIGAGSLPELTGRVALRGLALNKVRGLLPADVTSMFTGGRVDVEAKLASEPRAVAYKLDGGGKLSDVKLKGEPASGSFKIRGRVDPATGAAKLEVTDLAVKGPGVDLGGTASLDTSPMRARFAIKGPLLDLGTVLGLVPQDPKAAAKPSEAAPSDALLPPAMAKEVEAVEVSGTIDIDKVVNGKLTATNVRARAALKNGVLTLDQATAGLYGGGVDAGGTKVHLTEAHPRWNLKARLDGVDLAQALQAVAGSAPLQGKATGSLDLAGVGSDWDRLKTALTGLGALSLKDGALTTTDLGSQALGAIAQGLEMVGRGGLAKRVSGFQEGKTTLRDLAANFTVKDGWMALSKPLSFATSVGQAKLGGKIGLSQELALEGALAVTKEALTRAGLPSLGSGPVELPLTLGGSLTGPSVRFDAQKAVSGAISGVVAEKKQAVQDEAKREVRKRAEGLFDRFRK